MTVREMREGFIHHFDAFSRILAFTREISGGLSKSKRECASQSSNDVDHSPSRRIELTCGFVPRTCHIISHFTLLFRSVNGSISPVNSGTLRSVEGMGIMNH